MKAEQNNYFSESPQGIAYRENSAPWAGLGLALFSVFILGVTLFFLGEILSWPLNSGKIAGLFTVLVFTGASAIVGLLAFAAFQPQDLCFDIQKRRVQGRARGRYWPLTSVDVDFNSLQQPFVKSRERESDSDFYEVHMEHPGQLLLTLGSFENHANAVYWSGRLARLIRTSGE